MPKVQTSQTPLLELTREHVRAFLALPVLTRFALLSEVGFGDLAIGKPHEDHVATVLAMTGASDEQKSALVNHITRAEQERLDSLTEPLPVLAQTRLLDPELVLIKQPVNGSSNISGIGEGEGITQVWFSNGGTYRYNDPDAIAFECLRSAAEGAASVGRTFGLLRKPLQAAGVGKWTRCGWSSPDELRLAEGRRIAAARKDEDGNA